MYVLAKSSHSRDQLRKLANGYCVSWALSLKTSTLMRPTPGEPEYPKSANYSLKICEISMGLLTVASW